MTVPLDAVDEIRELSAQGHGRNMISSLTGIKQETVRSILLNRDVQTCDRLTCRQITTMLMSWGPKRVQQRLEQK